jgi:hypothetical protein
MSGKYEIGYHDSISQGLLGSIVAIPSKLQFRYTFENFFHPFVSEIVAQLNRGSLASIYDPVFLDGLAHDFFKAEYDPADSQDVKVAYFRKEIDLRVSGAYSSYHWELLFHIPLTIAVHLSKTQRFAEAQRWVHFIFDPTSNDTSVPAPKRFWKFPAFRHGTPKRIEELLALLSKDESKLAEPDKSLRREILDGYTAILNKPFQPHAVARTRHLAYQYTVVMKYLDNLIAWGDHLFQQDTVESINEATQRYVLAANILGRRPQRVPSPGKVKPKTFKQLKAETLDPMGNAIVELEGQFPFNVDGSGTSGDGSGGGPLFGIGRTLYFCIPRNDKLLGYWDTVADRLFKIRNCMNIAGVVRPLALFDPPLDPGMLVKAAAAGIDIGSIVNGLNQPVGPMRSLFLIQKALELCGEVRALGGALLAAVEKAEGEKLALIRQRHEVQIQQLAKEVRFLQWKAAEQSTQSLLTARATAIEKLRYYARLLGLPADPNAPDTLAFDRRPLNEENFDEAFAALVGQYEKGIATLKMPPLNLAGGASPAQQSGASGAGRLFLNRNENAELNTHLPAARDTKLLAAAGDTLASVLVFLPEININLQWWGLGASPGVFGGSKVGGAAKIAAEILRTVSAYEQDQAGMASRTAGHERRADEWFLQYNLTARELMQIGRQILTSLLAEQIARREYTNVQQQIANAEEVDRFLHEKFTNEELHLWMQGEISRLYYEYYRFAFDTARRAERTMRQELMRPELDAQDFVKFNYWDGGRKGLLSGEALHLDVKRMELAYHDNNKRELELTRHVSVRQLDPAALLSLRATGTCQVSIPEWLYDRDCPGHYMRRIKSVALSLPSVVGPYTGVHCTLSLLKSSIRKSAVGATYAREGVEDSRFADFLGGMQSVVTSTGTNDSGIFETNLRDDRFLPFEGGGAISTWKLELPKDHRTFDYATIADVILHVRYTARQGVDRTKVKSSLDAIFKEQSESKLGLLFSLRHDFPQEWAAFVTGTQPFKVTLRKDYFPYMTQGKNVTIDGVKISAIENGAVVTADGALPVNLVLTIPEGGPLKRQESAMPFVEVRYSF